MHKLYNYFYLFFYLQLARLAFLKFVHFVFPKKDEKARWNRISFPIEWEISELCEILWRPLFLGWP